MLVLTRVPLASLATSVTASTQLPSGAVMVGGDDGLMEAIGCGVIATAGALFGIWLMTDD